MLHSSCVRLMISSMNRKRSAYLSLRPTFESRDSVVWGSEPWQKWYEAKSKPASLARRAPWA